MMKTSEIAMFVGTLHTQPPGRETLVTFSKAPHVLLRWRGFVVEGEVGGHHGTVRADVEIARNPGRWAMAPAVFFGTPAWKAQV